jgi:hypothetical protein
MDSRCIHSLFFFKCQHSASPVASIRFLSLLHHPSVMSFFIHHAYLLWTYDCKPSRENEDDVVKSQTDEEKSLSSISSRYIHSLHASFFIHRWHPFFIPSAFLLVSCLFSFIMLSCCEEKQFVNDRSKRGRRRTLRHSTVSFSLPLSSVSSVCGAFLRGSLCGRSVYTSDCGGRVKMVRLCGSLCPRDADVFWIWLIVLQSFWIANFGIQIRQRGNVWSRVCRLLS